MIDLIGLVFGFLLLLALSAGAGFVVAVVVALIFWSRWRTAIPLYIGAIILGPLCVIWSFTTIALLPGESLFGDINERLPNGYQLSAFGKMPDFATIERIDNNGLGLPEGIATLQVQGDLVVGQYSHPLDTFTPKPVENYFLFDTRSGQHHEFPSSAALQTQLGEPLKLVPAVEFRSSDSSSRRQRSIHRTVMLGPIIAAWATYIVAAIALRVRIAKRI